jgi:hypothetical protein
MCFIFLFYSRHLAHYTFNDDDRAEDSLSCAACLPLAFVRSLEEIIKLSALMSLSRPCHFCFHRFLAAQQVLEEQTMARDLDGIAQEIWTGRPIWP